MTYVVIWAMDALSALSRIEQAADDRERVREAANRVDYTVSKN